MNILITGGAGFIGRWVVKQLMGLGHRVWVFDNLSNGSIANIQELQNHENFGEFIQGDIKDTTALQRIFQQKFEICFHLAASINVQDSIDDPRTTFENDASGTLNVLECCRAQNTKIVYMSTCMIYDQAAMAAGINEASPVKAASPYAGAKLAGEYLVQAYHHAYGLPVVIARPFNTYGPHQKSSGEGGVVSIFLQKELAGADLNIYGDGKQTRDLLYVEDCANFLIQCGFANDVNGEIINAGTGQDISVNALAGLICKEPRRIKHVTHIHPQSEIPRLLCDYSKAKRLLGWEPKVNLEEGIDRTRDWIKGKI